jgi:AraC-like DNA-binding protein
MDAFLSSEEARDHYADDVIASVADDHATAPLSIQSILWYIKEHLWDENLAVVVGQQIKGNRELTASFTRAFSCQAATYIRNLRMSVAASLLAKTEIEVQEICRVVCYVSLAYFHYSFREWSGGVGPREWRRRAIERRDRVESATLESVPRNWRRVLTVAWHLDAAGQPDEPSASSVGMELLGFLLKRAPSCWPDSSLVGDRNADLTCCPLNGCTKSKTADEYVALDAAAQPIFEALRQKARALSVAGLKSLVLYLVTDNHLFGSKLTATSWLKACRVNLSSTSELFTMILRIPPTLFLREAKIEVGVRLLAMTQLTVAAIGDLLGFGPSTFERGFVRWAGHTACSCRPWLRLMHGKGAGEGLEILSRTYLLSLADGTAPSAAYHVVFRLLYERCVEHLLGPDPNPAAVAAYRTLFTSEALDELLATESFSGSAL